MNEYNKTKPYQLNKKHSSNNRSQIKTSSGLYKLKAKLSTDNYNLDAMRPIEM